MNKTACRAPLLIGIAVAMTIGLVGWFVMGEGEVRVDTNFATKATLRWYEDNKPTDEVITDANDIKALKEILAGDAWEDVVTLGFDNAVLTLTNGRKSITFHPAVSGDPYIMVGDDNGFMCRHLTDEENKAFQKIMRKYGLVFPL